MNAADTLPRLLRRNAASMPTRPAFRLKQHGIWQVLTWSELAVLVGDFASGLEANGIGRGARLAVLGENRPRLYAAMLAIQSLGGAAVPLHPDAEPAALGRVLRDALVSVVVAQDREHAEKLTPVRTDSPDLALVVCETMRESAADGVSGLRGFDAIVEQGRAFAASRAGSTAAQSDCGHPEDIALLLYSADTGAALSHRRLLAAATAVAGTEQVRAGDNAFCCLPMTGVGDAVYSLALGLLIGITCNCPEAPHTILRDLREIGPNVLLAPPPFWAALARSLDQRSAAATRVKRHACAWFRRTAGRVQQRRATGTPIAPSLAAAHWLSDLVVGRPLRDQLGLARLRWAHVGEPLDPELRDGFRALGVNLGHDEVEPAGLAALRLPEPAHV